MYNAERSQIRVRSQESELEVMGLIRVPAAPVDHLSTSMSIFSISSNLALGSSMLSGVERPSKYNSLLMYHSKNSTFERGSPVK